MTAMVNCLYVLPNWVHYCRSVATTTRRAIQTRSHGHLVSHMRAPIAMLSNNVTSFCLTCIRFSTSLSQVAHQLCAHCITTTGKMKRPVMYKMSSSLALHCFLHRFMSKGLQVEAYTCQERPGLTIGMGQNILVRNGRISPLLSNAGRCLYAAIPSFPQVH